MCTFRKFLAESHLVRIIYLLRGRSFGLLVLLKQNFSGSVRSHLFIYATQVFDKVTFQGFGSSAFKQGRFLSYGTHLLKILDSPLCQTIIHKEACAAMRKCVKQRVYVSWYNIERFKSASSINSRMMCNRNFF